jgi:hypothetical protein
LYVAVWPAAVCCAAPQGLPLLVFANKMDLPDALQPAELAEQMQLPQMAQRAFHIWGCSALRNEGVQKGMKWLAGQLQLGWGRGLVNVSRGNCLVPQGGDCADGMAKHVAVDECLSSRAH